MNSLRSLLLLPLLLLPTLVSASSAEARLERFLHGLTTLNAGFSQMLLDHHGKVVEQSEGVLQISRPGRFRLEYLSPWQVLYIADGEWLQVYDVELQQVTRKRQAEALDSTPALLLTSDRPISEQFEVEELGMHEGFHWLQLNLRDSSAGFDFLRLAIEDDVLRAMEMADNLGQRTRLYFYQLQRNQPLADDRFHFTPPVGVDVMGDSP
jgi:outer membrane lipoprotein carrier protein